jgi:Ca2+-binding EF-hand superfamily protein
VNKVDYHVKVIDWGLGFFFGGSMRMKSAVGSLAYAAPEVLEAEDFHPYTSACDLWSLGAMCYVLLCGKPPFWGSIVNQLGKMKAASYPMNDAPWPSISNEAKDFIRSLLKANARDRLPIDRVMQHRWLENFRNKTLVSNEALSTALHNMEKSSLNNKFISACLASAARQLDCTSFKDFREVFHRLDANHDGTLDMEELRNGFLHIYGMDSDQAQQVAEMFVKLDLDGDGRIDYTEFCAAALSEKMLEQENILWMAFKSFDVHNDDGKITKAEIEEVLSSTNVREAWTPAVCDAVAKDIMQLFDTDGRGYLTFDDWLRMMKTNAWPDVKDMTNLRAQPSASSAAPPRKRRPTVAWASLDPRSGQILAYPKEISKHIEAHWQMKKESLYLGAAFHNARVCFCGAKSGEPFQRTPNGLRDVRRLEMEPGAEEMPMPLIGKPGEFRFGAEGITGHHVKIQQTSGAGKNAIDVSEAEEIIRAWKAKEEREAAAAANPLHALMGSFSEATKMLWGSGSSGSTAV